MKRGAPKTADSRCGPRTCGKRWAERLDLQNAEMLHREKEKGAGPAGSAGAHRLGAAPWLLRRAGGFRVSDAASTG